MAGEKVEQLEMDIQKINNNIIDVRDILAQMNENLKTINLGLYGDEKNNYPGVIKRQETIELKIISLEKEIEDIKKINQEQDTLIKAKKSVLTTGLDIVKWLGLAYMVAKGFFGVDTMFGKFF